MIFDFLYRSKDYLSNKIHIVLKIISLNALFLSSKITRSFAGNWLYRMDLSYPSIFKNK